MLHTKFEKSPYRMSNCRSIGRDWIMQVGDLIRNELRTGDWIRGSCAYIQTIDRVKTDDKIKEC